MSESVGAALSVAIAVFGVIAFVLFRVGRLQKWPRRYHAAVDAPRYVRNSAFALLPLSLAILFLFGSVAFAALPNSVAGYFILLSLAIALAWVVVAIRWTRDPPEFLKPAWMRAVESGRTKGEARRLDGPRLIEVSPRYYVLSWVGLAGLVVVWFVLDRPPAILIGVGIGAAYLAASRPRAGNGR